MIEFKMFFNDYGFHYRFSLFGINMQGKIFRSYNMAWTTGIRNNTPDGKRLIFIDYDNHKLDFIVPELRYLQEQYLLSDIYIFRSSQKETGFHAFCLDKIPYEEFVDIMKLTSCDEYYKTMPASNDFHSWVLRSDKKSASHKPRLIKILKSNNNIRKKSLAHALYLRNNYGISRDWKNLDNNTKLYVIKYGTLNFIDMKKEKV